MDLELLREWMVFLRVEIHLGQDQPCRGALISTGEQLLCRNVNRFRGGLVFKAHRLVYRSTLGSRVTKKKKKVLSSAISTPCLRQRRYGTEGRAGLQAGGCCCHRPS